ncbi:MAG: hypothetical protein U1E42_14365 [Rhodospirillales bacterium]
MIDPFSQGAILAQLLLAGLLTLIVGALLLVAYRRSVQRWMAVASGPGRAVATARLAPPSAGGAFPALDLRLTSDTSWAGAFRSPTFLGATAAMRRAAMIYALAGFAHAATATVLQMLFGQFEFLPIRASVVFWANAWPVVLTLMLLWGADRRRQGLIIVIYFAVLAVFAGIVGLGPTPPLVLSSIPSLATPAPGTQWMSELAKGVVVPAFAQPLMFWVLLTLPTVYLLLFLNRRVRSIGPLLLVFMLIAAVGSHLATVALSGWPELFASAAVATGTSAELWVYGFPLFGMVVFAIPGWLIIRWIGRRYRRKQFSDQSFVFDGIWLFASLLLCQSLLSDAGYGGWAGLATFVAWKLVCRVGLAAVARRASERPPAHLLLLRVFGFQRRTERLFSVLSARWRYAGPIQLIAAPDLATANIEPGELLDFVSGRLRNAFIKNEAELGRRVAERDVRPDPDGRFRVNEFFCTGDTWQAAVIRLMEGAHLVAMDLRGFTPANQGCVFEIETLVARVPAARIAFLVDATTDLNLLRQILAGARADPSSSREVGDVAPRILRTAGTDRTVRALLHLADEALIATPPATSSPRPQPA